MARWSFSLKQSSGGGEVEFGDVYNAECAGNLRKKYMTNPLFRVFKDILVVKVDGEVVRPDQPLL